MKKTVKTLLLAILICGMGSANAQQILSFSYNGHEIADGATIDVKAASNNDLQFKPTINNNEIWDLVCRIEGKKVDNTEIDLYGICTGQLCMDGMMSAPFKVNGNSSYDDLHIDFDVPATAEPAVFELTVYDTSDVTNKGTIYVRVHNKDANLGISGVGQSITLHASPNPAATRTTVTYSTEESATLCLYSIEGKRVWSKSIEAGEGTTEIDLSELPQGLYIYGIESKNGMRNAKKLIKR